MSDRFVIELPERLRLLVEAEAARRGFESVEAYVEALVHPASSVPEDQELEAKLAEVLADPGWIRVTPEYWAKKRERLRAELES